MSDSDVLYIDGDADAPILVIGEPPDEGAFVNGRALSRDERRFFDHVADSYGFRRDQFVFLPCAAPMPEDCVGDKDQSDHLALYRAEFLEKLHRCNPELIIPMGKHALRQLTGRAAQIGKARGQVQHVRGVDVPVLPMFGIRQCLWYPDNINIFVSDFNMVNLLELSDFDPACLSRATDENTDYQYTLDISEMLENRPPFVAVDTESTGLEWTNPDIRVLTVQLTTATGHARVIPVDERATRLIYPDLSDRQVTRVTRRVIAQLQALLEDRSVRKIGHNIKFDHHHIRESLGINIKGWFIDTQQLAFVVDDNMFEKSLDEVTRRWVPELAGYADCVVPDTEILTYDLKKKRAGDLQVGDKLCAFTAETDGLKAQRRKMEVSVVEGVQRLQRPTLKITTKSGRTTVVSTGHLMLCKKGLSDNGGGWRWRRADKLTVGSVLKPFPWHDQATDRDAGYMAGVFDGEGWCCTGKSRIGIAQRENACLDRVRRDLKRRRFRYTESQTSGRDVVNITIDGHEAFRALQIYGPHRLTGDASWVGCGLPTNYFKHDPIVSIEDAGVQEVVGLKTSTQTIIADGLLSHNSFNRTADKSNMLAELAASRETFLKYAGGDTDATYRSARALLPLAQEDETNWDAYLKIQLPALLAFADRVEPTGLYVDLDRLAELEVQVSRETVETERRVLSQIPRDLRRAHLRKGLRLSRRDLVSDALFTPAGLNIDPIKFTKGTAHKKGGDRVPSTSAKDHLIYFADEPLVEGIMRWSKLDKMRGTYVGKEFDPDKGGPTGFWKHVVRRDGVARIHPSFYLHRTKTGRSACVHKDTLITTRDRGEVRIVDLGPGDYVWTHKGRWRPVVRGFVKPVQRMWDVHLSNGVTVRATEDHRILTTRGWETIRNVCFKKTSTEPRDNTEGNRSLYDHLSDRLGNRSIIGNFPTNDDIYPEKHFGPGNVLSPKEFAIQPSTDGDEEFYERQDAPQSQRGMPGWVRLLNSRGSWPEVLCAQDSIRGDGAWYPGRKPTGDGGCAPHRRGQDEQQPGQSSIGNECGSREHSPEIPAQLDRIAITWVEPVSESQVFDIEVSEDHSYLAGGIFHHNSASPNAQNFPKRGDLAKAFRSVFVAPPGYAIVECDLSQAELRIAACQANETTMIRLYNEGIDIHMNTAAAISGNPVSLFIANKSNQEYLADHIGEFKGAEEYLARLSHNERGTAKISDFIAMLRYRAKAVNFGFLYGMQWRKFKVYAKTDYGIDYTDEEAQNIRDMFFETYPGLVEWHNRTEDDVYADGKVYALHGAVRRLPSVFSSRPSIQHESVRQAINSPIQRFASDLGIMALWRLCRDAPDDLMPVAFIHDALVCYVPEEKAHEYAAYIRYYMESNPLDEWFGLRLPVPILADASIGPRLSDMDEVHVDAVCPVWFNSDADTEAVYVRL